ncbi:MAG: hypothetical protein AVDCRST_MAG66-3703 [uncultured Pseudonocardia sp.]|uniref:SDR family NAD(P)-dependent oxidoreductase n=1 Tax=uncultured Pseudonocardia sp. TaxID=211455 RepID=A0A6J4Q808_9PSEU|nr:MAG: hypothetical protein AVDCRST_MAG66-3703 [uncultured Pseudonocardia sp.]
MREAQVSAAVVAAEQQFGALHLAFNNNAGVQAAPAPLHEVDPGEAQRVLDVNLFGVYRALRHEVPAHPAGPDRGAGGDRPPRGVAALRPGLLRHRRGHGRGRGLHGGVTGHGRPVRGLDHPGRPRPARRAAHDDPHGPVEDEGQVVQDGALASVEGDALGDQHGVARGETGGRRQCRREGARPHGLGRRTELQPAARRQCRVERLLPEVGRGQRRGVGLGDPGDLVDGSGSVEAAQALQPQAARPRRRAQRRPDRARENGGAGVEQAGRDRDALVLQLGLEAGQVAQVEGRPGPRRRRHERAATRLLDEHVLVLQALQSLPQGHQRDLVLTAQHQLRRQRSTGTELAARDPPEQVGPDVEVLRATACHADLPGTRPEVDCGRS